MRKPSNTRVLTAGIGFLLVAAGLLWNTGLGTHSSFGWDAVATICPVGFLESLLAGGSGAARGILSAVILIVLVLVFGRAFCGWLCPVPLVRRLFGGRKKAEAEHSDLKDTCAGGCAACTGHCLFSRTAAGPTEGGQGADADTVVVASPASVSTDDARDPAASVAARSPKALWRRVRNSPLDSRHAVLIGALASTAIFGFPVFCLICPVGLSIATFIALWRFISMNEATLSLIVFPAILAVELFVMKRWCHRLCPLSACMSLLAKGNVTLRPTVDPGRCLREQGTAPCHACFHACPEAIDLHDLAAGAPMDECMKCRECAAVCPEQAITFPLSSEKVREGTRVLVSPRPSIPTGERTTGAGDVATSVPQAQRS